MRSSRSTARNRLGSLHWLIHYKRDWRWGKGEGVERDGGVREVGGPHFLRRRSLLSLLLLLLCLLLPFRCGRLDFERLRLRRSASLRLSRERGTAGEADFAGPSGPLLEAALLGGFVDGPP